MVFPCSFFLDSFPPSIHNFSMSTHITAEKGMVAECVLGALKKVETLALFTVSDDILTGAQTTAEERQTTFNNMIEIALRTFFM